MRPAILYPLFAETTTLKGVGPRFAKLFEKLTGPRLVDLLWHLPASLIDRSYAPQLSAAESGRVVTLKLEVLGHNVPRNPRQPHRVKCHDGTAAIDLVFFHVQGDYLARLLPEGSFRVVSGKLETFGGGWQITHPDYVVPLEEAAKLPKLEAVYPLTAGLSNKQVGKAITGALGKVPALAEWIDPAYLARQGWPSFFQALKLAHHPASTDDLSPLTPARQRLAFDELLANQLALALVRARQKRARGKSLRGDGKLRNRVLDVLPFRLTGAQQRAIQEILGDMADETRMLRLLQGDVGSGKTLVALMALLTAVEAGGQGALMAPTEILARQHFETLQPLCLSVGVGLELITGRDKGRNREGILRRIAEGQARIVVGTHAVFQEDVIFKNLLLAVVDEQHRFGVHQRLALAEKGEAVDILVMTATPIPRTLTLTLYGDMDVSRLDEKPPGRLPIDTRVVPLERLEETIAAVGRGMAQGRQVYWVCPLVEDSELIDLAAAKERFAELNARFPGQVGLIHGSMKGKEKDAVMAAFAAGQLKLLVATTVIEVGVNVPAASVMVVEHAERFGLAQLHQLRGRVGRGMEKSICLLIYGQPLGEVARQRLEVMRASEDGFFIAEEDLRLRGGGEVLGTKQSGFPEFRLADLGQHLELLAAARDDARLQLSRDPGLESERGKQLRTLLYLFERDEAVRMLKAG